MLQRYDSNSSSTRNCKRLSESKTSEVLLSAEFPSTTSAPHFQSTATSEKRKNSRSINDSKDTSKSSSLPSTTLRPLQSENLSKAMSVKLRQTNRDDELPISSRQRSASQTEISRKQHQRMHSSSSDSQLSSPRCTEAPWSKCNFSKLNCSAGIQKRKSKKTQICRYICRCFVVSLICCLTDVATFGFTTYTQLSFGHLHNTNDTIRPNFFNDNSPPYINHATNGMQNESKLEERVTISLLTLMAYNGNMIVNLVCMILCYDKFIDMLFPCFMINRSRAETSDET